MNPSPVSPLSPATTPLTVPNVYLPNWWQLWRWIQGPLEFQAENRQRYGDVFELDFWGLARGVLVGDPVVAEEILSQDFRFDVGRGNLLAEPLLGVNSLILMDGDRHRRERKLLMPSFHGDRLKTYSHQIRQITLTALQHWQPGQRFVARSFMQDITLEVIIQVIFGLNQGPRYKTLKAILVQWLDLIDSPLRSSILFLRVLQVDWGKYSPWGAMRNQRQQIYDLLQAEIEERRSQDLSQRTDILSLMMEARDEQGEALSDPELRDEMLTLMFAGHETTATILAWAIYEIHHNPAIKDRLHQDLATVPASTDPLALIQLPYLKAVSQEVLRKYPVIPSLFPRIPQESMVLGGYQFDTSHLIYISGYLLHHREEIYPNPQQFNPDRFLDRTYSPYEYLPFGGGNRRCLGYALAEMELRLVLATILQHFELELAESKPVVYQRRGFTLSPKGGVKMRVLQAL